MAQHAKPKLIGQIEFFLAQLMAIDSVVVTMLSEKSPTPSSSMRANNPAGRLNSNSLAASTGSLSHDPLESNLTPVSFQPSSNFDDALTRASTVWGVEREYWDIWGKHHTASEAALVAILRSMGVDASSAEALDRAVETRHFEEWSTLVPPALVLCMSEPATIPVSVAALSEPARIEIEVDWEDGSRSRIDASFAECSGRIEAAFGGVRFLRVQVPLPGPLPLGYHRAVARANDERASTRLIVCPDRAYHNANRSAGIAVSLYGLRSHVDWGCGDFTSLRRFSSWAGAATGVAFIGINPLHAIANRTPYNTSPYLPNCSFYRNHIYLDVEALDDFARSDWARRILAGPCVQQELAALRDSPTVEYERVSRIKLRFLKLLFREFWRDYRNGHPRTQPFRDYTRREGQPLQRFAVHCALDEALHRARPDVWNWPDWPRQYHDPDSPAVAEFAVKHPRSILFYQYVQWLVEGQLAAAHQHLQSSGLATGIFHDLALATDRCGADLWAQRSFYVSGCRVGAPPDGFSPKGQDWGFPPPNSAEHFRDGYRLFSESLRKNCQHGGALRIDHVMRFFRLYWIPEGMDPTEGTYVQDRYRDLIRILALESVRNRVVIVGEDLGTVPDFVRETLSAFGILSYRLFYFEQDDQRQFRPPDQYPEQALVSASTFDLPTVAGFWLNRDIENRRAAGLLGDDAMYWRLLAERGGEKQKMLDLLLRLGFLPPGSPTDAAGVPGLTGELHNAVMGFLASTPCSMLLVNQEDLFKETEQQNLPGSTSEYPNWQRKMRYAVEELEQNEPSDCAFMLRQWLARTGRLRGN